MAAPFSGLASHRLNAARTASCVPQRREEPQTTDSPVGDAIRRPPTARERAVPVASSSLGSRRSARDDQPYLKRSYFNRKIPPLMASYKLEVISRDGQGRDGVGGIPAQLLDLGAVRAFVGGGILPHRRRPRAVEASTCPPPAVGRRPRISFAARIFFS